ncbi:MULTISPECIES: Sjogren's syndrome/scleroderma autoantigen 1 family protein [Haloferax]|uniref:Sjogrens syndrome scleroderma autoantigen 1 n=1 Tax=Haloferax marinum TaxID=2666143 RepID=A0A6A8G6N7_9EURY|nr:MULTISPECIES: Sjogren's syndrome/scleroderma autoantigen 1 family protein [Haloferax]KAB1197715.1 hypothetical protein Hfx1150_09350 [Haloferax sp. CBA1150]MRW96769.1 hypothetical protein [Haloferax marinum]
MSEFDKEAERQKLREKYERDERKRQSTQRMSELLLKGATMTNKHCDQCGDPIFRYNGQEFCPTCQTQGQAAASADADAEDAAEAVAQAEATPAAGEGTTSDQQPTESPAPSNESAVSQTGNEQSSAAAPTARPVETESVDVAGGTPAGNRTQAGGVDELRSPGRQTAPDGVSSARESLVRTLTWAATQAESTDDPRRSREFLAAAREAAEAIAALDR